jgi:hypothetical protein
MNLDLVKLKQPRYRWKNKILMGLKELGCELSGPIKGREFTDQMCINFSRKALYHGVNYLKIGQAMTTSLHIFSHSTFITFLLISLMIAQ